MTEVTFTEKNLDRIRNIQHDNFLLYLSSAYEVLRKIFSYLSLEDLENVSKAFEKWRPVVETTKKERAVIETFVISQKCQHCEIWSEACFCVTFCLSENKELESKLKRHITADAQFLVVESTAGVIGTPNDYSQVVQQKMLRYGTPSPNSAFATHLRIPSISEVGIKIFTWDKSISFKDFRKNFSLPDNKVVKCLLILITLQGTNKEACEQKDDFVIFLQEIQSESFAVGGCLIDSFLDSTKEEAITKYVVFYGDKVEAASIVLDQDVSTKEKINSKVEELKEMCPKTEKGILFVFRCCSRNKIFRQAKARKELSKWEGDALLRYFPRIPIIGCFGYGEFGQKYPDYDNLQPPKKKAKQSDIWEYSFSTSIVYVGFKK